MEFQFFALIPLEGSDSPSRHSVIGWRNEERFRHSRALY